MKKSKRLEGINLRVGIKVGMDEVYSAISTSSGLSNWWAPCEGDASSVGGALRFKFPGNTLQLSTSPTKDGTNLRMR